ncbi:DNA-binding transcriptional regulator, LysR family [Microlunatus sagamiharensis]|uniref:DNA-binding transcriptional regulator, LysR family n=1 Tax=Microlunatus sagamiharensis TaxID=546874 RepID=A0A1H2ML14_9ACTN|nr:LysR family transcriptional regulator [Microlunatus sagamiharensis]SDU93764.1 DNA-binding transcriptional regulator, LysR family [Microlunatus sagamiharensis]
MDVRQLAVLRELGDRGSVTAVAEALFITPSAVSQQLAALQRGVGVPLTRRQGRRLVLTDAGEALAAAAADVAAALSRAEGAVEDFLADPGGLVRVAAFSSAGAAFFPALVRVAAAGGPGVECAERDVAQSAFPALCAEHDVVLAHRLDHSPPWPRTVTVTRLLHEPLDVALPAEHPLAHRSEVTAEEVSREPWVAVHEGFPLLAPLEAIATTSGRSLTMAHRVNELSVVAALVAAGAGVALMPRHTAPAAPGLVLRPLRDLALARHVDALVRPERALRRTVAAVLAALVREAEALTGDGAPAR